MKVVYLCDENIKYDYAPEHFEKISEWAKQHCFSYLGHHLQDVSDVSYEYDWIAEYRFKNSEDALLFELRWS